MLTALAAARLAWMPHDGDRRMVFQQSADVTEHDEAVRIIAGEIERYLTAHPRAADTVEGIRTWWLVSREGSLANVQKALGALEGRGVVERRRLPDGTTIYASASASGPPAERAPEQ